MSWRFVTRHPKGLDRQANKGPGAISQTSCEMTEFVQFSGWSHNDAITQVIRFTYPLCLRDVPFAGRLHRQISARSANHVFIRW